MTDAELLRAAIQASGLSARKFATTVLIRDERTIRRWVKGDTTFGPAVRAKLLELLKLPSP
jgi:hypothetical protein